MENNALDSVGINNGTANNVTYTAGLVGQSAVFDGVTSSIGLGRDNPNFQLIRGSLVCVLNTTAPGSSYRGVLTKQNSYNLYLDNGVLIFYDWGTNTIRSTGINVADGLDHVIVKTFDSDVINGTKIYVDGVLVLTSKLKIFISDGTQVAIGGAGNLPVQLLKGKIDEVAIFDSILTSVEVSEITTKLQSGQSLI